MNAAPGAFGEAPYGATKRVGGVRRTGSGYQMNAARGAFGGAPYGATICVRGAPNKIGVPNERGPWGLRWSSL